MLQAGRMLKAKYNSNALPEIPLGPDSGITPKTARKTEHLDHLKAVIPLAPLPNC
jgi:hypothetical protein